VGSKNKLRRFAENLTFDNLFQIPYEQIIKGFEYKGKWREGFFRNDHEIILELGCGKGEYTIGLARNHPDKNFIGVDIKGARIWRGLKTAEEENLFNVAFIRTRINQVEYYFGHNEVSEIWITFPDPQPRKLKISKRLTSPGFLDAYSKFLKPGGIIHLKTDNIIFFEYTLDVIKEAKHELLYSTYDVYTTEKDNELTQIQTFYEKKWLEHGTKIKYLKFKLNSDDH
jgi:tRNA (guanine-N7-)-methyltransferase